MHHNKINNKMNRNNYNNNNNKSNSNNKFNIELLNLALLIKLFKKKS